MKHKIRTGVVLIILLSTLMSIAQEIDAPPSHKNERGLSFSLATAGLGLGGFYRKALPHFIHLGVNLEFFILRDDKEFEFIDNFGRAFKINDVNRFFTIPLTVELKKRMFTNDIEDDFRPHILAQAGVIYGMNFPRDIFVDEDVVKPKNQFEFTYNFIVGIGVDVTTRENYFFTIRTQYRYVFFPEIIAGKRNHSAFEIKLELGGQL